MMYEVWKRLNHISDDATSHFLNSLKLMTPQRIENAVFFVFFFKFLRELLLKIVSKLVCQCFSWVPSKTRFLKTQNTSKNDC